MATIRKNCRVEPESITASPSEKCGIENCPGKSSSIATRAGAVLIAAAWCRAGAGRARRRSGGAGRRRISRNAPTRREKAASKEEKAAQLTQCNAKLPPPCRKLGGGYSLFRFQPEPQLRYRRSEPDFGRAETDRRTIYCLFRTVSGRGRYRRRRSRAKQGSCCSKPLLRGGKSAVAGSRRPNKAAAPASDAGGAREDVGNCPNTPSPATGRGFRRPRRICTSCLAPPRARPRPRANRRLVEVPANAGTRNHRCRVVA